jgi:hypothetical protein
VISVFIPRAYPAFEYIPKWAQPSTRTAKCGTFFENGRYWRVISLSARKIGRVFASITRASPESESAGGRSTGLPTAMGMRVRVTANYFPTSIALTVREGCAERPTVEVPSNGILCGDPSAISIARIAVFSIVSQQSLGHSFASMRS